MRKGLTNFSATLSDDSDSEDVEDQVLLYAIIDEDFIEKGDDLLDEPDVVELEVDGCDNVEADVAELNAVEPDDVEIHDVQ